MITNKVRRHDAARRVFRSAEVAIVVEHPNARARTVLSADARGALAADLE